VKQSPAYLNSAFRVEFIQGNGDREVLAVMRAAETVSLREPTREARRSTAQQLQAEHEELLASWPKTFTLAIRGLGQVLFCHATP
jgi:hypothetical protein